MTLNLGLFITKLYVGLSANSISIYSDAVNNFFDFLAVALSLLCLYAVSRKRDITSKSYISKAQELITLGISLIIAFTGFYFAYSSLERLMYPTAVNFRQKYLAALVITALIKLMMFLLFRHLSRKSGSSILKVIAFDCLLDFFVNSVTVMTLLISKYGFYSLDALCGIGISLVIMISAGKMISSGVKALIGYIPPDERETFLKLLYNALEPESITKVQFLITQDTNEALVYTTDSPDPEGLQKTENESGITVHIISGKEHTEISV